MKNIAITVILLLSALTVTGAPKGNKTIKLKVIETSDVHGHFFPWDFTEGKPLKGTLVRANNYINKERKKYGSNLLLIDNGDILQGQPCVYWTNFVMPEDENLAARVINYMRYDAETVGNHCRCCGNDLCIQLAAQPSVRSALAAARHWHFGLWRIHQDDFPVLRGYAQSHDCRYDSDCRGYRVLHAVQSDADVAQLLCD